MNELPVTDYIKRQWVLWICTQVVVLTVVLTVLISIRTVPPLRSVAKIDSETLGSHALLVSMPVVIWLLCIFGVVSGLRDLTKARILEEASARKKIRTSIACIVGMGSNLIWITAVFGYLAVLRFYY